MNNLRISNQNLQCGKGLTSSSISFSWLVSLQQGNWLCCPGYTCLKPIPAGLYWWGPHTSGRETNVVLTALFFPELCVHVEFLHQCYTSSMLHALHAHTMNLYYESCTKCTHNPSCTQATCILYSVYIYYALCTQCTSTLLSVLNVHVFSLHVVYLWLTSLSLRLRTHLSNSLNIGCQSKTIYPMLL